jgi:hypothetical protein
MENNRQRMNIFFLEYFSTTLYVRTVGVHTLVLPSRATLPPRAPPYSPAIPPRRQWKVVPLPQSAPSTPRLQSAVPQFLPAVNARSRRARSPAVLPLPLAHPAPHRSRGRTPPRSPPAARIPPASTLDASDEAAEGMGVRGEGEVGGADVRWLECRPFPAAITSAVQARIHGATLAPPPILQSQPLQHRRRHPSHLPHRIRGARLFTGDSGRPCPPLGRTPSLPHAASCLWAATPPLPPPRRHHRATSVQGASVFLGEVDLDDLYLGSEATEEGRCSRGGGRDPAPGGGHPRCHGAWHANVARHAVWVILFVSTSPVTSGTSPAGDGWLVSLFVAPSFRLISSIPLDIASPTDSRCSTSASTTRRATTLSLSTSLSGRPWSHVRGGGLTSRTTTRP